jgi:alpha-galactosidase
MVCADGKVVSVSSLPEGDAPGSSRYPFSFVVGGVHSDTFLERCVHEQQSGATSADGRALVTHVWIDRSTGLRTELHAIRYSATSALDWVLWFENTGTKDTPIIENVQVMDLEFDSPAREGAPYLVHRATGGVPSPEQFEPSTIPIGGTRTATLGAGSGRSSTKDLPFFRVDTGNGAIVFAVGWSGCWQATLESPGRRRLHATAGMARTRFVLRPGERVRGPRMLVLCDRGEPADVGNAFRDLVHRHYTARRSGGAPLPLLFSNTCFTRGGGWLNECNAENQISLIKAYATLGLEAVITDAGWFEGGWPAGAGNWTPRKDAYPSGIGPVAAAAKDRGMVYGLWFEPERVVAGTGLHREHPSWLLASKDGAQDTYLLNMGLKDALFLLLWFLE